MSVDKACVPPANHSAEKSQTFSSQNPSPPFDLIENPNSQIPNRNSHFRKRSIIVFEPTNSYFLHKRPSTFIPFDELRDFC